MWPSQTRIFTQPARSPVCHVFDPTRRFANVKFPSRFRGKVIELLRLTGAVWKPNLHLSNKKALPWASKDNFQDEREICAGDTEKAVL